MCCLAFVLCSTFSSLSTLHHSLFTYRKLCFYLFSFPCHFLFFFFFVLFCFVLFFSFFFSSFTFGYDHLFPNFPSSNFLLPNIFSVSNICFYHFIHPFLFFSVLFQNFFLIFSYFFCFFFNFSFLAFCFISYIVTFFHSFFFCLFVCF